MQDDQAGLLHAINSGWGWTGTTITKVHDISPMGHMILSDGDGQFHYLDTDGMELSILGDKAAVAARMAEADFQELWSGGALVESARARLGEPPEGSVFTLSPIKWIEGDYSDENMVILPLAEIAFLSGDLARQLEDLPDGASVKMKVVD